MTFLEFMNGHEGKALRNVLGVLLVGLGFIMHFHNNYWYIVSVIGLVPIMGATFDFCVFSVFSRE